MTCKVALGSILAGVKAPVGTDPQVMEAELSKRLPNASLIKIRDNGGRDGERIIIWSYKT